MNEELLTDLLEAVRVRPNATALKKAREYARFLEGTEGAVFKILIEMNAKVLVVLAKHGVQP